MSDRVRYRINVRDLSTGYAFGCLSASAVPGPVMVRMLTGLGMGESAARNLITQHVHKGALAPTRVGRVAVYRFTDQNARKYQQVEGTSGPPAWSGDFDCIVYDIPERERAFRDRFRYLAHYNTYGTLRPGVLIAARPHSPDLDTLIEERPSGSRIHLGRLTPSDHDQARGMARAAWDLDDLQRRYRRVIGSIAAARSEGPGDVVADPWAAYRRWTGLYGEVLQLQLADPDLPAELLPSDWPRQSYWTELAALNASWGPEIQPALRAAVAELDPHGLTEYYPPPWETPGYGG